MPRRAALSAPAHSSDLSDRLSDLALSHSSSPLSHLSHQVTKSPLPEGTNGTLKPRRDALGVLNALFTLLNPLRSLQNA